MKLTAARRAHIASAFAVGTLAPGARAWVERRLRHDAELCLAVTDWQDHLARWVELLAPVEPRPEVWEALARRVAQPAATPAAAPVEPVGEAPVVPEPRRAAAPEPERWLGSLASWRLGAGLALAAALALAVGLALVLQPPPPPSHTAVFADGQGRPVWIVDARLPAGRLEVRALPTAQPPPDRAYELWMIPADGAPVSLGLLPASGTAELVLPAGIGERLLTAAGLAVSLEPPGGSPTGQPTGPVVYQSALVRG